VGPKITLPLRFTWCAVFFQVPAGSATHLAANNHATAGYDLRLPKTAAFVIHWLGYQLSEYKKNLHAQDPV